MNDQFSYLLKRDFCGADILRNRKNIWSSNIHLPFNHWNENLVILGIPYGTQKYVNNFWGQKVFQLQNDVSNYNSFHYLTLQAKCIISKSILLPKLSYISSILTLPQKISEKINRLLVRFIVPHGKTFLNIDNLAAQY